MIGRNPYMFLGELCDFDKEVIEALEFDRLVREAEGVVVPAGFDLSDPQTDE